jgi:hypothetical protein
MLNGLSKIAINNQYLSPITYPRSFSGASLSSFFVLTNLIRKKKRKNTIKEESKKGGKGGILSQNGSPIQEKKVL